MLAWASARGQLCRAVLDVPDIVCTYGVEVDEDSLEASVLAETGMKTPWIRYTLDEFVARLGEDLPTYHLEAPAPTDAPAPEGDITMAPTEAPAPMDVTMAPAEDPVPTGDVTLAPTDVVVAVAETPAPNDEISLAREFLRGRFAAAALAAPARRGRPKAPIVCDGCKLESHSSDAKYNHLRRGKCNSV
jgi:hypothetical protein